MPPHHDSSHKPANSADCATAAPARPPLVRFEAITKRFGPFTAIDGLSLDIFDDEFVALLGPSGCGKTTLLRLLAGFETPDAGRIVLDGVDLNGVPPYRRAVNTMFQSYALFPHLTVEGNVAFGLRYDGLSRTQIASRVREMLALVKLEGLEQRKPDQLSGGQRQRVALARSLAKRPRVLLLDEPLAALDRKLRESTQAELVQLQRKLGTTFVIVTHDKDEAMTVADRVAVMERGRLAQVGSPRDVYQRPNSRYVADFLGAMNLIEGRVIAAEQGRTIVEGTGGARFETTQGAVAQGGETVWFAIRPENIRIDAAVPAPVSANTFAGGLIESSYLGDVSNHIVQLNTGEVLKIMSVNAARAAHASLRTGAPVSVSFDADAGIILTH